MIYNNPDVGGAIIDPELMARLSKVENIVALKDNTPIIGECFWKTVLIKPDDMALTYGGGELGYVAAAAYDYRYKGFVTSIGNFAPELSYAVYEAVEKERDFVKAQKALLKIAPIFALIGKWSSKMPSVSIIPESYRTPYAYMGLCKAAMDMVGLYGGPLRLPLQDSARKKRKS
jgi:4-hydroxy-tetrahydrodipicolinate synthase